MTVSLCFNGGKLTRVCFYMSHPGDQGTVIDLIGSCFFLIEKCPESGLCVRDHPPQMLSLPPPKSSTQHSNVSACKGLVMCRTDHVHDIITAG